MLRPCSALGVFGWRMVEIEHRPYVVCANGRGSTDGLNQCTSQVAGSLIMHWAIALGGGARLGATIGLLLARRIRPRRRIAAASH